MSILNRLQRLEDQIEHRRRQHSPLHALRVALQVAMMSTSVPAGIDGSPERQKQLAPVARLQKAYDDNRVVGVENELITLPPTHVGH